MNYRESDVNAICDDWESAVKARNEDTNSQKGKQHTSLFDMVVALGKNSDTHRAILVRSLQRISMGINVENWSSVLYQIVKPENAPKLVRKAESLKLAHQKTWLEWADKHQLAWRKS